MAIDTSIYGLLKPVEMPSYADSQEKAMRLSNLAMQNQNAQKQMQAEDQKKKLLAIGTAYDSVMSKPAEERESAWNDAIGSLVKDGHLDAKDAVPYSDQTAAMIGYQLNNSPEYLQIKKAQAELASAKNDPIDRDLARQEKKANIAKSFAEAHKLQSESGGKPLAAEQSDKLAGHDASLHMIGDLRQAIESNKSDFGPFMGRLSSMNPYDVRGQEVSALFKKAAQTIGKSLEGGKLTDQDYAKYQKMLPTQSDTPEVAKAKLDQLERMVTNQRNSDLNTYSKAGLNVRNFSASEMPEIEVTKPKASKSSIAPDATASTMPKPGAVEDGFIFMGGDPSNPKSWKRKK